MHEPKTPGAVPAGQPATAAAIDVLREAVCPRLDRMARDQRSRNFHAGIRNGLLVLTILVSAWLVAVAVAARG